MKNFKIIVNEIEPETELIFQFDTRYQAIGLKPFSSKQTIVAALRDLAKNIENDEKIK